LLILWSRTVNDQDLWDLNDSPDFNEEKDLFFYIQFLTIFTGGYTL
jgi:hypothetical protein